ncbi:MAG: polysaccharide pyruvyl transferase family protein, partial [Candidatus Peribacteraceae bacterium]|nr:polysaccharide pyruvyl transferase family protein [Candidatus Peribacteraceae bacterium]
FQGIGPFKTCIGNKLSRWVVDRAEYISVRDYKSLVRIEHWFKHTNIIQSFDPVILLIEANNYELSTNNVLSIIPRDNSNKEFKVKAKEKAETKKIDYISILTMKADDPEEQKICKEIRLQCGGEIRTVRSIEELCREIGKSCCVISQRYHGALVAFALGKDLEIVSQAEGDKLSTIRKMIEDGDSLENMKEMAIKGENSLRGELS